MIIPTLKELEIRKKFKHIKIEHKNIRDLVVSLQKDECISEFFSSLCLLRQDRDIRNKILNEILLMDKNYVKKIEYLIYAFKVQDEYLSTIEILSKNITAENIFLYLEYIFTRSLSKGLAFDGMKYEESVVDSQMSHLTSCMPFIFELIRKGVVIFSGRSQSYNKSACEKLVLKVAEYAGMARQIIEVMNDSYNPLNSGAIYNYINTQHQRKGRDSLAFYLEKNPIYWRYLETYRDLNYFYEYRIVKNSEESLDIFEESGVAFYDREKDILKFDLAKSDQYEMSREFFKVKKFITEIYGDLDRKFIYKEGVYKIIDLINLAYIIYKRNTGLLKTNTSNFSKRKKEFIIYAGKRSFFNKFNIQCDQAILLDLFSFDVDSKNDGLSLSSVLPIYKKENIYFMSPYVADQACYEKVIDKILSSSKIKLDFDKGYRKGNVFEDHIKKVVEEGGYKFCSVDRNNKNNIPEIDGVIQVDREHVILYEAKCSIKPEERGEAYGFVENHFSKAVDQLKIRVDALLERPDEMQKYIKFPINGVKVIPMILTNHPYFTGIEGGSLNGDRIGVIDIKLFEKILISRRLPVWKYNSEKNGYHYIEKDLKNTTEITNALINPVSFINGIEQSTIQILDSDIAFEISKAPSFIREF